MNRRITTRAILTANVVAAGWNAFYTALNLFLEHYGWACLGLVCGALSMHAITVSRRLLTIERLFMSVKFDMQLRGQAVHVEATMLEFSPEKGATFTVHIRDASGELLPWRLNRLELAQVCRRASQTARSRGI
jgi:hypothetical protein